MTSGLTRQVCSLKLIQCRIDNGQLTVCTAQLQLVTDPHPPLYSVNTQPPPHTLVYLRTGLTIIHLHTCPCSSWKGEEDVSICPSSPGINVRYRSILESIGSHYLSSVTYLNCYGCGCLPSPSRLCLYRVIPHRAGETEASGES